MNQDGDRHLEFAALRDEMIHDVEHDRLEFVEGSINTVDSSPNTNKAGNFD